MFFEAFVLFAFLVISNYQYGIVLCGLYFGYDNNLIELVNVGIVC